MDLTDWLSEALHGPMRLRFIVQPLVALLLGLRDGRRDHEEGNPPFVVGLIFGPGRLRERVGEALHQIAMPLALAVLLDAVVQFSILGRVHPLDALWVGALLIALPYALSRGLMNRLLGRRLA